MASPLAFGDILEIKVRKIAMYEMKKLKNVFVIPETEDFEDRIIRIYSSSSANLPSSDKLYVFKFNLVVRLLNYVMTPAIVAPLVITGPARSGKSTVVRQFCNRVRLRCEYYDARQSGFALESITKGGQSESALNHPKLVHVDNADALSEFELKRLVDWFTVFSPSGVKLIMTSHGDERLTVIGTRQLHLESLSLSDIEASMGLVVDSHSLEREPYLQAKAIVSTIIEVIDESGINLGLEMALNWLSEALILLSWGMVEKSVFSESLIVLSPLLEQSQFKILQSTLDKVVERKLMAAKTNVKQK